jgi:hypothetical protein
VPAAAFGLTVWEFYVYKTRVVWILLKIPELRHSWILALPAWIIGVIAFHWFTEFGHNQSWVESERCKRFNFVVLFAHASIIAQGWGAYAFTSYFLKVLHRVRHCSMPLPQLAVVMVIGLGFTAMMEWGRGYVPREEEPEPPLPPEALYAQTYREVQVDWWHLSASLLLIAFLAVAVAVGVVLWINGEVPSSAVLVCALVGFPAAALTGSLGRSELLVTPKAVTHRWGLFAVRLPLGDIETCGVGDVDAKWKRPRGVKMTSRRKRGGPFVEIAVKNGRVYRLGAIRPTHICHLIEKARKDLPPTPSAAEGE